MLIAQITDIHLGFVPDAPDEDNRQRLDATLALLTTGVNRPDLLIVSGDLTDRGDVGSYRRYAEAIRDCPFPVYPCLGNHDARDAFAEVFPHVPMPGGFLQYCIAFDGLRIVVLDTLEPGRQGGGFCAERAVWLSARLQEDRTTPTIIAMHHPPFDAGIDWIGTQDGEPWARRFAQTIAGHAQVRAIWCGHLHRPIVTVWNGVPVTVCPATTAQLALDLRPIDAETMDDRAMVTDDPPGYALHLWQTDTLVTHFDIVRPRDVYAKFDAEMQPVVQQVAAERAER